MSIRACIEFIDEHGETLFVDRSHDGFSDLVLQEIKRTVEACTDLVYEKMSQPKYSADKPQMFTLSKSIYLLSIVTAGIRVKNHIFLKNSNASWFVARSNISCIFIFKIYL
jgi:hypothetical protein